MSRTEGKKGMTMYMSRSGKGCNMVTPNGKKNVYCNLNDMVEFLEGKSSFVDFTIDARDVSVQSSLDSMCEDKRHE